LKERIKRMTYNQEIKQCTNCIKEIINENIRDIGDDVNSDYYKFRSEQNEILEKAIFYLEGINDPTHGFQD
jgi:hypothetical protein